MTLGDRIYAARSACGYTLEYVAGKIGISRQTLSRYENGIIQNIPSDKIEQIAEILETTPEALMGWDRKNNDSGNGDLMALREQLRRRPGLRVLFDATKNATEQDLLDAAAMIEIFKKRRDGE